MYRALCPCPGCQRHVLASATECPFCEHTISAPQLRPKAPAATRRMSRSAVVLLGASLALAACSSSPKTADPPDTPAPEPVGPPDDDGAGADLYGGPPQEEEDETPEEAKPERPKDDGAIQPMYGVPAPR